MDLEHWLRGRWTVDRAINGRPSAFTGTAEFTVEGEGLRWDERGRLVLDAYDGPASRTLHLAPGAGAYEVRFDDGRPFHALDLASGRCEAEHLCGEDVYRGEYVVAGDDALVVTWRIEGPAKDELIETRYERA